MKIRIIILSVLMLLVCSFMPVLAQTGEGEVNSSDEAVDKRSWGDNFIDVMGFLLSNTVIPTPDNGKTLDLESGVIYTGYSDVRIPGDTGTLFSLSDDLKADVIPSFRARFTQRLGERHNLSLLIAPLRVVSKGSIGEDINFDDITFLADTDLKGTYWFNSYRLTYRYDFVKNFKTDLGIGFTVKIREAGIMLEGGGQKGKKTNVGFVPIVNFRYNQYLAERLTLQVEGDALAAPQGRAEDVFAGVLYRLADGVRLKLGYRLLEGGADNDKTYNFALFHYGVVGVQFGF